MDSSETQNSLTPVSGLRAATAVCRERGISDTTLWRWARRHWVRLVNIAGRCYVDMDSLAEFDRRARAGEFSKPPAGAARRSADARRRKEGQ